MRAVGVPLYLLLKIPRCEVNRCKSNFDVTIPNFSRAFGTWASIQINFDGRARQKVTLRECMEHLNLIQKPIMERRCCKWNFWCRNPEIYSRFGAWASIFMGAHQKVPICECVRSVHFTFLTQNARFGMTFSKFFDALDITHPIFWCSYIQFFSRLLCMC